MNSAPRPIYFSCSPITTATFIALAAASTVNAQSLDVIDAFSAGPVELEVFSTGVPPVESVGGNYDDPDAIGGRRSLSLLSSFQTVGLVVDDTLMELRFDTDNGVGQFFLTYGSISNNGMGVQDDPARRLNADWSNAEAIRFHLTRNDVRMSITTNIVTNRNGPGLGGTYYGQSSTPEIFVPDSFTGDFEIPLAAFHPAFGDGVDWADVDYLWFSIACRLQGSDFTIDEINLIRTGSPADLDGDGAVGSSDLAILLAAWGGPDADIENNGVTDSSDLAILLAAWG